MTVSLILMKMTMNPTLAHHQMKKLLLEEQEEFKGIFLLLVCNMFTYTEKLELLKKDLIPFLYLQNL